MTDELTLEVDGTVPLTEPALLVALGGWFDAAGAATAALRHVAGGGTSVVIGEIDPDPFYDFTVTRPTVERDGDEQRIRWPRNVLQTVRTSPAENDLVVFTGVEPHVAWPTFVSCIMAAIERLGIGFVVTCGAVADATPHTRPPIVVGSATDPVIAARFGLAGPTYQGPTGVVGVLHGELERRGIPAVSLRVGVPAYLPEGEHPRAVAALVDRASTILRVDLPLDLGEAVRMWDDAHDAWVAENPRLRAYVELLEQHYDSR